MATMRIEPAGADTLLNATDVAEVVAVGKRTLYRWVSVGTFPPPDLRVGGVIRWRSSTVQNWIDTHTAGASK